MLRDRENVVREDRVVGAVDRREKLEVERGKCVGRLEVVARGRLDELEERLPRWELRPPRASAAAAATSIRATNSALTRSRMDIWGLRSKGGGAGARQDLHPP